MFSRATFSMSGHLVHSPLNHLYLSAVPSYHSANAAVLPSRRYPGEAGHPEQRPGVRRVRLPAAELRRAAADQRHGADRHQEGRRRGARVVVDHRRRAGPRRLHSPEPARGERPPPPPPPPRARLPGRWWFSLYVSCFWYGTLDAFRATVGDRERWLLVGMLPQYVYGWSYCTG